MWKKRNGVVQFKPKIIPLWSPPTSLKLLCNLKKQKSFSSPAEGQQVPTVSSLTIAAGLVSFYYYSFFLLSSVIPAPLDNCFSIFKELRLKVNNVRNYLKYTQQAGRDPFFLCWLNCIWRYVITLPQSEEQGCIIIHKYHSNITSSAPPLT